MKHAVLGPGSLARIQRPIHFACNSAGNKPKKNMNPFTMGIAILAIGATNPKDEADKVVITGMKLTQAFSRSATEELTSRIKLCLDQLPDGFNTEAGISLVEASFLKDGSAWMDDPYMLEALLMLGIGADLLEFTTERSAWPSERVLWPRTVRIRAKLPAGAGSR